MKRTLDWNAYVDAARRANAEGCVLLENRNQVLPLAKGTKVSIFGRIQDHYYKSGTGSGGMVGGLAVADLLTDRRRQAEEMYDRNRCDVRFVYAL